MQRSRHKDKKHIFLSKVRTDNRRFYFLAKLRVKITNSSLFCHQIGWNLVLYWRFANTAPTWTSTLFIQMKRQRNRGINPYFLNFLLQTHSTGLDPEQYLRLGTSATGRPLSHTVPPIIVLKFPYNYVTHPLAPSCRRRAGAASPVPHLHPLTVPNRSTFRPNITRQITNWRLVCFEPVMWQFLGAMTSMMAFGSVPFYLQQVTRLHSH